MVCIVRFLLHKQSIVSVAISLILTYITFLVLWRYCNVNTLLQAITGCHFWLLLACVAVVPHTAGCKVTSNVVVFGNVCHSCM